MRLLLFKLFLAVVIATLTVPVAPAPAASPTAHDIAPDFSLTDIQGTVHTLAGYRGKVVVLNFWATWCNDCVLEMPSLDSLSNTLKNDGLVVVGISIDRNRRDVERMRTKVSYPLLLDQQGDVFVKKYTITRLPMTIIIDRNGVIVEKIAGSRDFSASAFIEKMKNLLLKPVSP